MNMPVKWHLAAHIACKIKHKKIGTLTSYEKISRYVEILLKSRYAELLRMDMKILSKSRYAHILRIYMDSGSPIHLYNLETL